MVNNFALFRRKMYSIPGKMPHYCPDFNVPSTSAIMSNSPLSPLPHRVPESYSGIEEVTPPRKCRGNGVEAAQQEPLDRTHRQHRRQRRRGRRRSSLPPPTSFPAQLHDFYSAFNVLFIFANLAVVVVATATNNFNEIIDALNIESLRNNLVQSCDGERITLHCPRNTQILIQTAFYGRLVPSAELCPAGAASTGSATNGTYERRANATRRADEKEEEDTSCDMSEAHTKMKELCHGRRKCRVDVRPQSFGAADPCPSTSKYLQISYKCKPTSFDDQIFCEGTNMQLTCRAGKRLAIYSAHYGRIVDGQAAAQCGALITKNINNNNNNNNAVVVGEQHQVLAEQQQHRQALVESGGGVQQDCMVDVLPELVRQCHSRVVCSLGVNDAALRGGRVRCPPPARKYLALIYVCVNDEIFSESALNGQLDGMAELEEELAQRDRAEAAADVESASRLAENGAYEAELFPLNADGESIATVARRPPGTIHPNEEQHYAEEEEEEEEERLDEEEHKTRRSEVNGERETLPTEKRPVENGDLSAADGFAGDFESFMVYLKENHQESALYAFLGIALCLLLLLVTVILVQYRRTVAAKRRRTSAGCCGVTGRESRGTGEKYGGTPPSVSSDDLLIGSSGGPKSGRRFAASNVPHSSTRGGCGYSKISGSGVLTCKSSTSSSGGSTSSTGSRLGAGGLVALPVGGSCRIGRRMTSDVHNNMLYDNNNAPMAAASSYNPLYYGDSTAASVTTPLANAGGYASFWDRQHHQQHYEDYDNGADYYAQDASYWSTVEGEAQPRYARVFSQPQHDPVAADMTTVPRPPGSARVPRSLHFYS